jgi:cyclopropane fatty-acyl-phospholipid synthase-like methyltransferase
MPEFHNLAELTLNRNGQSWGNLGYWKTETEYSDACRALALLLGEQAGLGRQSVVFDAGFGCGDQLVLWLEYFRVSQIYGANLSRSQTAYAKAKLANAGLPTTAAMIVQGDIDDPEIWTAALALGKPSHVLALDCAYHFQSRTRFLALAQKHLAPAGRLALTDFLLSDRHRKSGLVHWLLRWMLRCSHISETNIVHRHQYLRQLMDQGFGDIQVLDISEHVMRGFGRSFRKANATAHAGKRPGWKGRVKYVVTGLFLDWAYSRSILRYCVISATKGG